MIKAGYVVDNKSSIIPTEIIQSKVQEIIDNSGIAEHINTDDFTLEPENPDDCG